MKENKLDIGVKCPICKEEWAKTPRIVCNDYWYHCKKCGKKADDIVKDQNEKGNPKTNPISNWKYATSNKDANFANYTPPTFDLDDLDEFDF